jgi:hypothetical protein
MNRIKFRFILIGLFMVLLGAAGSQAGTGSAESNIITVDTTGPTGTVTINGGAVSTTNPTVTLTLSASDTSGVTEMKFSIDNATWSASVTYGTTIVGTLSGGNGSKMVYVKFKDAVGNWSDSYSATIYLAPLVFSETYSFERMWPGLKQPWYFTAYSVAMARDGFIYVADSATYSIVKLSSDGQFITKWGGQGSNDGQFQYGTSVAVDNDGFVYAAGNSRIQKFTSDGQFVTKWGSSGTADGQFGDRILGIAGDGNGYIYVTDASLDRIQKFTSDGQFVAKWGGNGTADGQFNDVRAITVDRDGFIHVVDLGNSRIQKFNSSGQFISKWGSFGQNAGQLGIPFAMAADRQGFFYIADFYVITDTNGNLIKRVNCVKKFTANGQFVNQWEVGNWLNGELPWGITLDDKGYIYVATVVGGVEKYTTSGQLVAKWSASGGEAGKFRSPSGVAIDGSGNIYVADTSNHRIQKFASDGQFIRQWDSYGSNNGQFRSPYSIAFDRNGYFYVADAGNSRIQKFDSEGNFKTKWGSYGDCTVSCGNYQFNSRMGLGITVDGNGYVYVADRSNYRVQKYNSDGIFISQLGGPGDGDGQFSVPEGITVDSSNNVYVSDASGRIQKFSPSGTFLTKWGSGDGNYRGFGDMATDASGNVYVRDGSRIQKFSADGQIITIWGEFGSGPGLMGIPEVMGGLAVGADGKVYVADTGNHRIQVFRKVSTSSKNKAIIVAGGGGYSGNDLWNATRMSANFAYRTLMYQGFTKANIRYLSSDDIDLDNNGIRDDITDATNDNLMKAITEWALGADNVVVYLVDHGGIDSFRMSGSETLSASLLSTWLEALQNSITGKIIVIYDACHSGSFIADIKPPSGKQRIVITSTLPGESAYFLSQGSVSFSNYFWDHIFNGLNIKDAFDLTESALQYTTDNQHPQLDDNGSGSGNEGGDGILAQTTYIGNGTVIQGSAPVITNVSANPSTVNGTNSALLYATGVTAVDGIARVWAIIRPPGYNQGAGPVQSLPSIDLMPVGGDRYEVSYTGFNSPGTYLVAIYALDRVGNTSVPKVTQVSVNNPLKRRAIIVAGGSQTDELWLAVEKNAGLAYDALKFQGYTDEDIYFMSPVTFTAGVDVTPVLSNLNYAIKTWAASNTQDLVIYMIGSGGDGTFTINGTETLTAASLPESLKAMLDDLQAHMSGKVTVIYDAPRSGSFISALSPPQGKQRIVLTSTGKDQTAYYSSGGDVSFSKFFWCRIANGMNVRDSFLHAKNAIGFLTGYKQGSYIDDNGNGKGNEKLDGLVARDYTIGFGITLGADDPMIGSVSSSQTLNGETSAMIWARDVTTTGTIDNVWAVITPPGSQDAQEAPVSTMLTVPLTYNSTTTRYEGTYSDFTIYGEYSIAVYAMDTQKNMSLPSTTKVIQTLPQGITPDRYEVDDTYQQARVIMLNDQNPNNNTAGYEKSQIHNFHRDGDEDWVVFYGKSGTTYKISVTNPGPRCDASIRIFGSDGTTPMTDEMDDYLPGEAEYLEWTCPADGVYYMRIRQGSGSENIYGSGTQYELSQTIPQAAYDGFIKGFVNPAISLARVSTEYGKALTLPDGSFFMPHMAGDFDLMITADGYNQYFQSKVHVNELLVTTLNNISLTAVNTTPAPTLNQVASPTKTNAQTITGAKGTNTSVWLNGTQIVPSDASTPWSYNMPLSEGRNPISLVSRNTSGAVSSATESYIILDTIAPITIATPIGGIYSSATLPMNVTLTANEQAVIYYTTNGTVPTEASAVYSVPIPIAATTTLKYFAKDTVGNREAVKIMTYDVVIPIIKGDVNNDGVVNLHDLVLGLQVLSRTTPAQTIHREANISGNGKIGLAEVIYILHKVAGIR